MGVIDQETFKKNTAHLSDKPAIAGAMWCAWAQTLADKDRPAPGESGRSPEHFLGWIWKELQRVAEDYGEPAAAEVMDMALYGKCLYPYEIYKAGEEFSRGINMEVVFDMSVEGELGSPQEENDGPMTMAP